MYHLAVPNRQDGSGPGDVTRLPSSTPPSVTRSGSGWLSSSDAIKGRFAPGTILVDRYRMVGLLGKGGMGEVYRADDLKLGQVVALKFLPESLAQDPVRLAQFHGEVRLARQISHPNVCRVYDVDDLDGHPFLTMEYIDGEDLSSLLRRIGRLPEERALEMARQFCAGVAAAHDRGVLHRDLKPANVMIDGRGHVRVMDFGLAAAAGTAIEVRAGTPGYMAPEQLAGREVSIRSDVYAIGLVLFELFTGRRAFEASSLAELLRLHESDTITPPTALVAGLDPAIERAILRCLEREPARRPASALAVAASLPGGDPLAAALAAGETPSPAMVAAAGKENALATRFALGGVIAVGVMLVALAVIADRTTLLSVAPPPKPIDVLVERAQTVRQNLGYGDTPRDEAYGLSHDAAYLSHIAETDRSADRWVRLRNNRPSVLLFWYRSSPRELVRFSPGRRPTPVGAVATEPSDPPFTISGMTAITTDTQGRLLEFNAVTPQFETPSSSPARGDDSGDGSPLAADWSKLFAAAELPFETFTPSAPMWTPRSFADTRVAWEGSLPEDKSIRVRVEAAAYQGRPVFFSVVTPWTSAGRMETAVKRTSDVVLAVIGTVIAFAMIVAAGLIARRHLRRARGDRHGADRLAFIVIGFTMVSWVFGAHHHADVATEADSLFLYLAMALLLASVNWLFYLALEPLVRKWRPHALVGWTRALSGAIRDPQVGRDLLAGVVAGCVFALIRAPRAMTATLVGEPMGAPYDTSFAPLIGVADTLSAMASVVPSAIANGMLLILAFSMLRGLVRRDWIAFAVIVVLFVTVVTVQLLQTPGAWTQLLLVALGTGLVIGVVIRFGLLTTIVMFFFGTLLEAMPLTVNPAARYFATATWLLAGIFAFALFAAYAARAGQPLFRIADD